MSARHKSLRAKAPTLFDKGFWDEDIRLRPLTCTTIKPVHSGRMTIRIIAMGFNSYGFKASAERPTILYEKVRIFHYDQTGLVQRISF